MRRISPASFCALSLVLVLLHTSPIAAQETGTVSGQVTRAADGEALSSVSVTVQSTGQTTVTGNDGKYTLRRVPAGSQMIVFRWLGYRPSNVQVTVAANASVTADASLRGGDDLRRRGGRVPRARPDRRGPGGDPVVPPRHSRARRSPPRTRRAPGHAGRGRRAERDERLQREPAGLQLLTEPGAMLVLQGRPRPRHRLPRLAGVERDDPAARGLGQGRDGARAPGLASMAPTPSAAS